VRLFFLGLELRVVFVFAKEIRQSLGLASLADRRPRANMRRVTLW
jgi:hypothetical protein